MSAQSDIAAGLMRDLRAHLDVCQQTTALMDAESVALAGSGNYDAADFCRRRKGLLPVIEASLNNLRRWRQLWQEVSPDDRAAFSEANHMFQTIQNSMMRILLLDRENQQALLRRGLVPAQHLPPVASQQSHFVAGIYRRHCVG